MPASFDRIDHDHLLASLGPFPARDMIQGWLKAGVAEQGRGFAPTVEGTPQGGVLTPPTKLATWLIVTLRIRLAVAVVDSGAACTAGDAVTDRDPLSHDE